MQLEMLNFYDYLIFEDFVINDELFQKLLINAINYLN